MNHPRHGSASGQWRVLFGGGAVAMVKVEVEVEVEVEVSRGAGLLLRCRRLRFPSLISFYCKN